MPDYQGFGVGAKLMNAALAWLGTDQAVELGVAKYNLNAIEFYQKFGFEIVGETDSSKALKLPSGKTIPVIKMIRKVSI